MHTLWMKLSESITLVNNSRTLLVCKLQSSYMKDHMIKNNKLGDFNPIFYDFTQTEDDLITSSVCKIS